LTKPNFRVLCSNACYVPIDVNLPSYQKSYIIQNLELQILVTSELLFANDEWIKTLNSSFPSLKVLNINNTGNIKRIADIEINQLHGLQPSTQFDLAYVMFTSGTTGNPKAVFIPQKSALINVISIAKYFKITSRDVCFLASPIGFDPSVVTMFTTFLAGAKLLVVSDEIKMRGKLLCSILEEQQVTHLQGMLCLLNIFYLKLLVTPSLMCTMPLENLNQLLCLNRSIRCVTFGGEPFPEKVQIISWMVSNILK
jgi:acyl-coenzyme A synthetase/AMP-(fatty) acid ligase